MTEITSRLPQAQAQDSLYSELAARFGQRLSTSESVRTSHAGIESHHAGLPPDAVVMPQSTDEVAEVVGLCAAQGVPVIAYGAGTSLEGHLSAEQGGVSIDLSGMTRILAVEPENLLCRVEAGVTREQLNHHLRDFGLFFPVDPGANATLGGMSATRASGTNAVRYGTMRDNVLSLEVVLADGSIIETGTKASKSSAGYDLTGLFIGSEGTLGVITAVMLRLYGIPEVILAATCAFDCLDGAVNTVITAIQSGMPLARIELLDDHQIAASNAYSRLDLPIKPTLFLEFHGTEQEVAGQADFFAAIASDHGGGILAFARQTEDRSKLWKARHNAYFAAKALKAGARVWTTDVCVPIAALASSIMATREDIDTQEMLATIVGHIGDGNYHVLFVLDPENPEDERRAAAINDRMVERALQLGGTCTGEHGIGLGKRDSLIKERGHKAVELMWRVKHMFDPRGILNPGKIFR